MPKLPVFNAFSFNELRVACWDLLSRLESGGFGILIFIYSNDLTGARQVGQESSYLLVLILPSILLF